MTNNEFEKLVDSVVDKSGVYEKMKKGKTKLTKLSVKELEKVKDEYLLKITTESLEKSKEMNIYNPLEQLEDSANTENNSTFISFFEQGKYKEMFQLASAIQDKKELMLPFYKLVTPDSLDKIAGNKEMHSFLDELNNFLNNPEFNEQEKRSFFNEFENINMLYALNVKKYDVAANINNYRKNKALAQKPNIKYMAGKIKNGEYEILEQLFSLSDVVTFNCSSILRLCYSNNGRNYDFFKKIINDYNLDINGLGTVDGFDSSKYTFAQLVALGEGTMTFAFFESFMKDFGSKVDFDIKYTDSDNKNPKNLFELLLTSTMEPIAKLNRLNVILKNCSLSEKHIGIISQALLSEEYEFAANNYDHPVFESLFSHEKFNSNLYDREAFLNKLLEMDTDGEFEGSRENSNFTVNPTSVILDKFSRFAKTPLPMSKHPFIGWLENENVNFSIDTMKSLVNYYREDLDNLELHKIPVHASLKKALHGFGVKYPAKPSFIAFLFGRFTPSKDVEVTNGSVSAKPMEAVNDPVQKVIKKIEFNNVLLDQVKDADIKKYVDAVKLNYEQYHSMSHNGVMPENEHYMSNLLPKFLNTTIENYLHFATLNDEEAKSQTIIQLKILNKKSFEALNEALGMEEQKIAQKTTVHKKIMQQY